jgi:ferredoxin-NADP reductase/DMSO/TMAO reductase YedYZ heme-binding membrane subunit
MRAIDATLPLLRQAGTPVLDARALRVLALVNGAVPLTLLAWDAYHGKLGVNAVNFALRTTGLLALLFFVLSLTITPLKVLSGWSALVAPRRALGLFGFLYLVVHFAIFFVFDRGGSVASTITEILTRRYLQIGAAALILFAPLAVTSTDGMISRLGPRRWKRLHRLTYLATSLGCIHYILLVKSDLRQPVAFAVVVGALLLFRAVHYYVALRANQSKPVAVSTPARVKFWSGKLVVARTFDETADVRTFRLAPMGGGVLPFFYRPGQYLNIGLTIDGERVNRSYTIASSPTRSEYCELTVKKADGGYASHHLHERFTVGSVLDVSAPAGRFVFEGEGADKVLLIGGGVGITPVMSILRALTDRSWPGRIELVIAARSANDIVYREELDYLVKRFPNLVVTVTLSREPKDSVWRGERGQIGRELLARVLRDPRSTPVYLCGPAAMMGAVRAMLLEMGVAESGVHVEAFVSPPRAPADESVREQKAREEAETPARDAGAMLSVRFSRSGVSADLSDGKTLLEAAEDVGVAIPFDCRAGICGQCKTRLTHGRVAMVVEDALTSGDRKAGLVLACQARAICDLVVDA